jgi:hypothetical protein
VVASFFAPEGQIVINRGKPWIGREGVATMAAGSISTPSPKRAPRRVDAGAPRATHQSARTQPFDVDRTHLLCLRLAVGRQAGLAGGKETCNV